MQAGKILAALAILFWACALQASEIPQSPNLIDDRGLKTGTWTILIDADWNYVEDAAQARYYRIVNYKAGKPTGVVRDYFLSGQFQGESVLLAENPDVFTGKYRTYYENGQPEMRGRHKDDLETGLWTTWHPDGSLLSKGRFKAGEKTGDWIETSSEGWTEEGSYEDGLREGRWAFWDQDWSIKAEGEYQSGKRTGMWREWYDSGIYAEGTYVDDLPEGRWILWHPDGSVSGEGDFLKGELHGIWKFWDEDGVYEELEYQHGTLIGRRL